MRSIESADEFIWVINRPFSMLFYSVPWASSSHNAALLNFWIGHWQRYSPLIPSGIWEVSESQDYVAKWLEAESAACGENYSGHGWGTLIWVSHGRPIADESQAVGIIRLVERSLTFIQKLSYPCAGKGCNRICSG